jgi:hypothetical protein
MVALVLYLRVPAAADQAEGARTRREGRSRRVFSPSAPSLASQISALRESLSAPILGGYLADRVPRRVTSSRAADGDVS